MVKVGVTVSQMTVSTLNKVKIWYSCCELDLPAHGCMCCTTYSSYPQCPTFLVSELPRSLPEISFSGGSLWANRILTIY
jgi:hypothetical protein